MTVQDFGPLFNPPVPDATSRAAFEAFHQAHPHVYRLFVQYAKRAITRGRRRYSARTILEVIRWHTEIETGARDFRLNNNWIAFYARLFEQDFPEHAGFFEMRRAVADVE